VYLSMWSTSEVIDICF